MQKAIMMALMMRKMMMMKRDLQLQAPY